MLHVSLYVELLRSHPRALVLAAALAQAALWWLVPLVAYSAPPGDLALAIAVGREYKLGSYWGPPLSYWLADAAYTVAGMPGVYLLAQACVVVAFMTVYQLGRAIVGPQHAAMATLLMVGVSAFAAPSPSFGPAILGMPLAALTLLMYWRALGEGRKSAWYALAASLGLLILTTYAGFILLVAIVGFTVTHRRGRQLLLTIEPWIAAVLLAVILFPHLLWIELSGMGGAWLGRLRLERAGDGPILLWIRQLVAIVLVHAGLLALVALAVGWRSGPAAERLPTFERKPLTLFERRFVLFFAAVPPFMATVIGTALGEATPVGGMGPNLVLSGLAVIVLAGNTIALHRQWLTGVAWCVLLVAPPAFTALGVATLPFVTAAAPSTAQPARAIGRFFGETFERRTGQRLAVVTGDPRFATLIALGARSRPSLFFANAPHRTPWTTADDLRRKGGIVVWPAADTLGAPPAEIKALFPDLTPELPQAFDYPIQGRLPVLRIGWGMLRPQ